MSHSGDGGRTGVALDDAEREFLKRCAERPDAVDPEEIFALLDGAGEGDADEGPSAEASDAVGDRTLGARALTQYARADPAGLAPHGDRILDYLDDEEESVRQSAVVVVQHLVDSDTDAFGASPVGPLVARLGREDQPTSKRLAQTLAQLLDADDPRLAEAVDTTVDLFAGDKHEAGSGIQALSVLGKHYPGPVVDRLTARLNDDNPDVRKYAVRTLATLSADTTDRLTDATDALVALLDDADDYTREHALATLTDVARADPGTLEPAIPRLTELVDADNGKVRRGAVRILAELGRADVDIDAAVDTLRGRLTDDDKIVRRDACYALGILRADEAVDDIRTVAGDYDLEFEAVAEAAIERITEGESDPPMADLEPGEIFTARL